MRPRKNLVLYSDDAQWRSEIKVAASYARRYQVFSSADPDVIKQALLQACDVFIAHRGIAAEELLRMASAAGIPCIKVFSKSWPYSSYPNVTVADENRMELFEAIKDLAKGKPGPKPKSVSSVPSEGVEVAAA